MPAIHFYNTETRQKELFAPLNPPLVKLYTCGPTVYDFAHIGNFRTYVFEDLLRRTLTYFGYRVCQVMNLTDIDDKTLKGSIKEGVSLKSYTQKYIDAFFEDLNTLGIQKAEHYPAATDYIPQMIQMIETLLKKKFAYVGEDGSIYFSIESFPKYGRLSHLKLEALQTGASQRVDVDEYEKESASDFVLWKAYDAARDGQVFWESPFGKGRPGWHIECSAMAIALLGETIDIHVGAVDNIFPHHENEIAQSECCSGHQFVSTWLHSQHLIVDGKKMSKSLGNFYTLRDLVAQGYNGMHVRLMLLQTHYRTQLNFTNEGIKGAKSSLERLHTFVKRLQEWRAEEGQFSSKVKALIDKSRSEFATALADDLNISVALAALFEILPPFNQLCDQKQLSGMEAQVTLKFLQECDSVLNVLFQWPEESIPQNVLQLVSAREEARKNKEWTQADELRRRIESEGYLVEDSPQGAKIKKC